MGFAKVGDPEARKSDDQLNIESVLSQKVSVLLNPFISVTARTQFIAGFEFADDDSKMKISKFLDPGYFTQSAGIGYTPNETITTRLGATLKETVTSDFSARYADDPDTPEIEKSRIEPGISSVTEFKRQFDESVLLSSRLDLFSDLEAFDRIDVLWESQLNLKVSNFITVSLNVDLLYDRDISERRQIKEVMAIGFTYTFL